jgi:hypothetical protein
MMRGLLKSRRWLLESLDINVFLRIIKVKNTPSKATTEESRPGERRLLAEADREAAGMD